MRVGKKITYFICNSAGVEQGFLNEDVPALINDLPEMILSQIDYDKKKVDVIRFRVDSDEKKAIYKRAVRAGHSNVSSFLRELALGK